MKQKKKMASLDIINKFRNGSVRINSSNNEQIDVPKPPKPPKPVKNHQIRELSDLVKEIQTQNSKLDAHMASIAAASVSQAETAKTNVESAIAFREWMIKNHK